MITLPAMAAEYDLVILNGRVMDPDSVYDAVANVGIRVGLIMQNIKIVADNDEFKTKG